MQRGVFGGSFDPVHLGHLTVARAAADRLGLDRVHFVPAGQQPFKQGRQGASGAHRAAMLALALRQDRRFLLDQRELERHGPSYTVDTLRAMRAEFPSDHLCFLVGADAARELPQWHEAEALSALARIVVLTRPGARAPQDGLIDGVVEVPAVDVSASDIRRRVAAGESLEGLVPPEVARYIAKHGLYRRSKE